MRADLPTGTVTFLFTDIEGSTRLLHALGPDGYADALAQHRLVLREAFAAHEGIEVDTQGDAFLVAFPTAPGAAAAARAGLEALSTGPIRIRAGLHTGAPTITGEGYVGVDVHRGARVGALAHGDQIIVSPATAALLDSETLVDLGLHRLKDFDGATRLFQLGGRDFPPLRTPGSIELPTPATRFLGRERELFDAVSLVLERDPRVLTILGPGGTGKTRFALELARLLAEDADGGTVFVALAPLRESGLVLATIAERLGAASVDVAAIASRVGEKRTHVVCDNVEHLLPEAALPLAELAARASALRIVATSREALRIQGEAEIDLPPLADDEAVALFCERAQAVRPDVRATNTVHELCERLDRLPLALELAAARTKLLAPEELLKRVAGRLDLLKGTRDADERHATLRATIAWSHDLLDESEKRLFRVLAVFRGDARSSRQRRCAMRTSRPWPRFSTRACCGGAQAAWARSATGCSRRSASSQPNGWRNPVRPTTSAGGTPSGCSRSRRPRMSARTTTSRTTSRSRWRSGKIFARPSTGPPRQMLSSASSSPVRSRTSGAHMRRQRAYGASETSSHAASTSRYGFERGRCATSQARPTRSATSTSPTRATRRASASSPSSTIVEVWLQSGPGSATARGHEATWSSPAASSRSRSVTRETGFR